MMSNIPNRKLIVKPLRLGPHTKAIILPAWWLKLNDNPESLELSLTLDSLLIRPNRREESHDPEHPDISRTSPNESLVLTVGETAKLLRLSKTTVYDQIRRGAIPNIRMGKRILIPRAALMRKLGEVSGSGW